MSATTSYWKPAADWKHSWQRIDPVYTPGIEAYPYSIREPEAAYYPLWNLISGQRLFAPEGDYLVLDAGIRNSGPGPDFVHARIQFPDGTVHCGAVEIDSTIADWKGHGHYRNSAFNTVILRVITTPATPLPRTSPGMVPAVYLPIRTAQTQIVRPCNRILPGEDITPFLQILARQRWERRLRRFQSRGRDQNISLLLDRLGRVRWRKQLESVLQQVLAFTATPLELATALHDALIQSGALKPASRNVGRICIVAGLIHQLDRLTVRSLEDLTGLAQQFSRCDLPTPSSDFLIEVAGNWLLPTLHANYDQPCVEDWLALPRGWYYARAREMVNRLGIAPPRTFGEQQGLLEWQASLCRHEDCQACPVA